MADDQTKVQQPKTNLPQNDNVTTDVPERPIDTTRNAQDVLGDTQGMTGITQGGLQQTSTEPEEELEDTTFIRGGVIQNPHQNQPTGYPKTAVSDKANAEQVQQGMSQVTAANANDAASEPKPLSQQQNQQQSSAQQAPAISPPGTVGSDTTDNPVPPAQTTSPTPSPQDFGDQTGTKYTTTQDAPYQQPYNQGEQDAAGGTTSDPRTDDDVLDMAQRAGMQTREDTEHPQEVSISRDVDQAEQNIKDS